MELESTLGQMGDNMKVNGKMGIYMEKENQFLLQEKSHWVFGTMEL